MTGVLADSKIWARRAHARPILVATIARPSGWTGVHSHFSEFLRALDASGHSGTLVTPFSGQEALANAVFAPRRLLSRVHPVANVWWYEEGHFRMLKRALTQVLRDGEEVTVYAQCPLSARAALEARTGPHQRVVMVAHFNGSQADEWVNQAGLSPDSRLYAAIQRREQRILSALDGIVYVSQYMRHRLESTIQGLDRVPSEVIPNFVTAVDERPVPKTVRGEPSPKTVRGEPVEPRSVATPTDGVLRQAQDERGGRVTVSQPQEPFVVSQSNHDASRPEQPADLISIGTLEPRKNQVYLLRVLAEAAKLGHHYTLSLVGDGADRAMLESKAHELGIRHQMRFLGFEPNARHLLPGHRAYVHAARFENLPIALIEALAAGLPIFAPNVGGISEVYGDGVEGLYWDLEDPASGARRLAYVLENPERQRSMSRAARTRFDTAFETTVVAARLRDFLLAV